MKTTSTTRNNLLKAAEKVNGYRYINIDVPSTFTDTETEKIRMTAYEAFGACANKHEAELYAAAKAFVEEYERSEQDED